MLRRTRMLFLVALLGCLASPSAAAAVPPERAVRVAASPTTVETLLAGMTLEEKVGQLFISRVYGETAGTTDPADVRANRARLGVDNAKQLVDRYHVGGVVYFAWAGNLETPQQILRLSNGIQRRALEKSSPVPLLISTDQEHGAVSRVGPPATQFPGSMALGATHSADLARSAARVTGEELAALGINQVLAPVADVNGDPANPVIGVRSFGSDAAHVSALTAAQVRGFELRAGVAATAKHFPGHGDTDVDSHSGLPVIHHTEAEWWSVDAPPFRAAVDAGVGAIMTAHISVPALDATGTPATLSEPIVTGILRERMGYDGVVVTDSLGMAGVRALHTDEEIPVLALRAGVDMLANPPRLPVAYDAVLAAVADGTLTEARIDTSVRRILALKERLGILAAPVRPGSGLAEVGAPEHARVAARVTDASITLVQAADALLPVAVGGMSVLVTGWSGSAIDHVVTGLRSRGAVARGFVTGARPSAELRERARTIADGVDLVIVLTSRVALDARQAQLVAALRQSGRPVIAVAIREPYDIAWFPDVAAYLVSASMSDASMDALLRVLVGERPPTGRLPVTIPTADGEAVLFPFGHGLGY